MVKTFIYTKSDFSQQKTSKLKGSAMEALLKFTFSNTTSEPIKEKSLAQLALFLNKYAQGVYIVRKSFKLLRSWKEHHLQFKPNSKDFSHFSLLDMNEIKQSMWVQFFKDKKSELVRVKSKEEMLDSLIKNKLISQPKMPNIFARKKVDLLQIRKDRIIILESKNYEQTGLTSLVPLVHTLVYGITLSKAGFNSSNIDLVFNGYYDYRFDEIIKRWSKFYKINIRIKSIREWIANYSKWNNITLTKLVVNRAEIRENYVKSVKLSEKGEWFLNIFFKKGFSKDEMPVLNMYITKTDEFTGVKAAPSVKSDKKEPKLSKEDKTYVQKLYNKYTGQVTCAFEWNVKEIDGRYAVRAARTKNREKYIFRGFKEDGSDKIVLLECPKDVLAIEFEEHCTKMFKKNPRPKDVKINELIEKYKTRFKNEKDDEGNLILLSTKEDRDKWVNEILENCKNLNLDACVADHTGTSKYAYLFNLKGLPEGNEHGAKKILVEQIVPEEAQLFVDWTNIGKTLIPVIGRPHWKPKYKGAIHKVTAGKDPLEHENIVAHLLINNVPEKREYKPNPTNEELKNKVPLERYLIKYGYDLSRHPTMCKVGHGSKGQSCFSYDLNEGVWYCFNPACDEGGSVIELVMRHENLDKREAIKLIAKECGIDIKTIEKKHNQIEKTKVADLLKVKEKVEKEQEKTLKEMEESREEKLKKIKELGNDKKRFLKYT